MKALRAGAPGSGTRRPLPGAVFRAAACCLLLAGLPGCGARPPEVPVAVRVSRDTLRVGDRVRVELAVRHPAGTAVQWDGGFPPEIERLGHERRTRRLRGGQSLTLLRHDLTSFTIGEHRVLAGRVVVAGPGPGDEPVLERELEGRTLRVESALSGPGEDPLRSAWRALPDPVRPPRGPLPAWAWVLPLAAAVALGVGLWARRFGRPVLEPDEPPPSPHEVALSALSRLRESGGIERGGSGPYFVALSGIVRRYLEARFDLRAPERTTEEFLREASESARLGPAHRRLTAGFLEQADRAKFARWEPGAPERRAAFDAAERLVRETAPAGGGRAP